MLFHQRFQRAWIVGIEVGRDLIVFRLAHITNDRLQVFGQFLILLLVDDKLGREAGFNEGRHVVVLGNLMEAERQIVVGADEFRGVQRARLQRLKDLARGHVGDRCAQFLPYATTQAGGPEAHAFDIVKASQFVAEPTTCLRAGVARQEALNAELVIDLVPDFLTAHIAHPGCQFWRGHAVGHAGKEGQRRRFVLPIIGGTVAHLGRAIDHGVQRLQRRHQLTCGVDLHGQTATGGRCDTVCQTLRTDTQTGEVFRPGGDHAPCDVALRNGGCGEC